MKAAEFLTDLEAKPAMLHALADTLGAASQSEVWPIARGDRLLLAGMGSSWFAAETAARRLRRAGVHAVAEMASVEASYPPDPRLVVVGISANGGSKETLALLGQHHGTSRTRGPTDCCRESRVDWVGQRHVNNTPWATITASPSRSTPKSAASRGPIR